MRTVVVAGAVVFSSGAKCPFVFVSSVKVMLLAANFGATSCSITRIFSATSDLFVPLSKCASTLIVAPFLVGTSNSTYPLFLSVCVIVVLSL